MKRLIVLAAVESTTDGVTTVTEKGDLHVQCRRDRPDVSYVPTSGWHVSVRATRSLAFLTSDTNGVCYTGPFPRP